jgi:glucuronate isomerase
MQIHPGVLRDHNRTIWRTYDSDKGYDIPIQTEYTRALRPMLERFGTDPRFRVILGTPRPQLVRQQPGGGQYREG